MHKAAKDYVRAHLPKHYRSVLEVGSLDINGGVRDLLDPEATYTGIDVQRGPGVDVVADFASYTHPQAVDLILCLEVLEHAENWRDLIHSAHRNLKPGGTLLMTCATTGRAPHSARSEGPIQPDEHYQNVSRADLEGSLSVADWEWATEVVGFDLRAYATRRHARYSVIIPSNDPERLNVCIDSLIDTHENLNPSQVVIVSDGLPLRTRWDLRGVTWVNGLRPFVFAQAINRGVAATDPQSDLVILGDDVRMLTRDGLEKLAKISHVAVAVGPKVIGVCGQTAQRPASYMPHPEWLTFICTYIPRVVWNDVGPLDEQFIGYGYDDADWCLRAKPYGICLVSDEVTVLHAERSAYRSQKDCKSRYHENRALFQKKWQGMESIGGIA